MSARPQAGCRRAHRLSPARARVTLAVLAPALCAGLAACGWGTGSAFIEQPLSPANEPGLPQGGAQGAPAPGRRPSVTLEAKGHLPEDVRGQNLGLFRNTYYDFPSEAEFTSAAKGEPVTLRSASCGAIAQVPRAFFETLCVQGSGSLARGGTVSFAKRDCGCADVCPRTGQKICFEALDPKAFPWGRGAAGRAIAPLRTVAADTTVLPMGTPLYIPELDGLPIGEGGALHDGCVVVEDRGLKVRESHIDIFTGRPQTTEKLEDMVPSNQGVHVVVRTTRCEHLAPK
jgi:3D (Asp-Asp-Asp) domain-containing protein